ncbi:MAG TPA: DUF4012 domain-containing protein [Candidatus Saccharimonadales bacterium]|nr:DUF4012 domain-containing protein [Candidatus Saccharimonadales bacterium]
MIKRFRRIILIVVLVLALLVARTALSLKSAYTATKKISTSVKAQDLNATKASIKDAKKHFQSTKTTLIVFTPLRIVPVLGWYVADAQRGLNAAIDGMDAASTFVDAITPYADVLGFGGNGNFLGGTAQERLAKAVETLAIVTPQMENVNKNLADARVQLDQIQTWRYPNILPGKPGKKIADAKNTMDQLQSFLVDAKPLLDVMPDIMGEKGQKKYLVIFQNDKELRPTGGFITAYAIFNVNKGAIQTEGSSDIYQLDATLTKKIPAPAPIIKYLPNVPTLNIRDTNLSPDYRQSMTTFENLYQFTQNKKDIDGIIALDTQFVVDMMNILGSLQAGDTKFTTDKVDACNCPQIIYQLEQFADQPTNQVNNARKDIIGTLMQAMMDKAFNAPKTQWPQLLSATIQSLRGKHLIMYFHDPKIEEAAEKVNFAGRVNQYDGDYLSIIESNFGGAKSNLYVQEKVGQLVKQNKDQLEKTLTIEYKYPRKMDNCSLTRAGGLCLAGIYRDWIRVYVPKGSKLIKADGISLEATEDLDKTVFEGFFELRPEGALKFNIQYTSPIKVDNQYKLLIQKQGGTPPIEYTIDALGKKLKPFPLDTDKELLVKP